MCHCLMAEEDQIYEEGLTFLQIVVVPQTQVHLKYRVQMRIAGIMTGMLMLLLLLLILIMGMISGRMRC